MEENLKERDLCMQGLRPVRHYTRGPAQQHPSEATKTPLNKILISLYKNPFYFYNTSFINPQLVIITLLKIFKSVGRKMHVVWLTVSEVWD